MGTDSKTIQSPHGVPASRKELLTLVDSIPARVASIDCNMVIQFANRPFRQFFFFDADPAGYSFSALAGTHAFSQIQRHLGKALVGSTVTFQISLKRENTFEYMDVNLSPEFDDQHRVKGFIFHGTDVTENINTQWALRDYFENASIGLHWVDGDGIIIWANPAELRMLGYTEEEYVGRHIASFHNSPRDINDILSRLSHNEVLRNYETEMVCKDGSLRSVSINSSVLWEGERFIHTRCFTVDITERKRAEQALRESWERFGMMARLVPLIIWTTDEEGEVNYFNERWKQVTGTDAEEGFGSAWLARIHPDDRRKIVSSWKQSLSQKKPFEAKFRFKIASGEYQVSYVNAGPMFGASGEFSGYVGIMQDISAQELITTSLEKIVLERTEDLRKSNEELRAAEKALMQKNVQLEKVNKELNSFAHVASHDLQEPLRKIQIFAGRMMNLEGVDFTPKGREFLGQIQSASVRMRSLIEDILAYSRTGSIEGQREAVELDQLVRDVINELELKIEEKSALVRYERLPVLPVVRVQFHQLFLNLFSNALKFTRKDTPPVIEIRHSREKAGDIRSIMPGAAGEFHHITFADNGIGFHAEYASKIFEIFQRLNNKEDFDGSGIGLAICKKIVENHGGTMVAESAPGQGAAFHIYIPAGE